MEKLLIDIAIKGPFFKGFTYYTDIRYKECIFPGQLAEVSFGKRIETGYVMGFSGSKTEDYPGIKPIIDIVNISQTCDDHILSVINFIAEYYHSPPGAVYSFAVCNYERILRIAAKKDSGPADNSLNTREAEILSYIRSKKNTALSSLKHRLKDCSMLKLALSLLWKRGFIDIVFDDCRSAEIERKMKDFSLSEKQNAVYNAIFSELEKGFSTHLIYGITGSGKTFIYLRLIQDIIKAGKQALILVPEIGLSIHLEKMFREFIPGTEMLHSSVGKRQKRYILQKARDGRIDLIIGPRSALFIPFHRLGIIIIDEEHDKSYKQESIPCYNARDAGIFRAKAQDVPIVLGSATPSIESYYNARIKNKYMFHELTERYGESRLPELFLVDLKEEKAKKRSTIISQLLLENLKEMFEKGDQGILFINRRGFYSAIICLKCGSSIRCTRCSVSMSYHQEIDRLVCHQCGRQRRMPDRCPYCGSEKQSSFGFGTEHVEELIRSYIPGIRILRFDSDNIRQRDKDKRLFEFGMHEYDIIVGTQMITKGFDFPKVNLVGVIQADESLYMPDFRGAERTYQIINQVSGRSGRRNKVGRVIIQTYLPEHYSIQYSLKNDYYGFAEKELKSRKKFGYPPYRRLCMISSSGYKKERVLDLISKIYERLCRVKTGDISIIGPVSAFVEKRKNMYRWNILLQGSIGQINRMLSDISEIYLSNSSAVTIDMDPYTF